MVEGTWKFRWKRLHVCLLCLWYLRHWPMNDLSDREWLEQLDGETAWDAFIEGWCRDTDLPRGDHWNG